MFGSKAGRKQVPAAMPIRKLVSGVETRARFESNAKQASVKAAQQDVTM